MALIVHKGIPRCEPGLDLIFSYTAEKKTKVASVTFWGFERLPYGRIVVRWKNGAIGTYTGPKLSELMDQVREQRGWPTAQYFTNALPFGAGAMFSADFPSEEPVDNEMEGEPHDYEVKRVVRSRANGDAPVGRQRRVRSESPL